jgi:uncharacterized membrane protein YhhN
MKFTLLLIDSYGWSLFFVALVIIGVYTQLTKTTASKSLPYVLRAFFKAGPAIFLSELSWRLGHPLIALAFLFCAMGDILLDLPEDKVRHGFQLGAVSFTAALICFSIASWQKQLPGHPLLPLSLTNVIIAVFVLRWVLPLLKGSERTLEVAYFAMLIISNVIASSSLVTVFLGSSLWFMSDLSIGLGAKVSDDPVNSLDTLGLYDLGLYFLAIGFLNY